MTNKAMPEPHSSRPRTRTCATRSQHPSCTGNDIFRSYATKDRVLFSPGSDTGYVRSSADGMIYKTGKGRGCGHAGDDRLDFNDGKPGRPRQRRSRQGSVERRQGRRDGEL